MIPIKDSGEIEIMRKAGSIAATVLDRLCKAASPGMSGYELDQLGKKYIEELGATSACFDYKVGSKHYPGHICVSVNEEVIHGIGTPDKIFKIGDNIAIDVSVVYNGYIGDNARTITLGQVDPAVNKLLETTQKALELGINQAREGKRVGDISFAIQQHVESQGFSVVRDFVGHGVGRSMHEEPQIPNFGRKNTGPKLRAGMTLAIEPMVNMGENRVAYTEDGWTAVACDGKPSAHFEHTVLITHSEPEILTIPEK